MTSSAPSQRQLRAGELIRHALSEILFRGETGDPEMERLGISVHEVQVSPDLKIATAFVRTLIDGADQKALEALNRHKKYIRGLLAKKVDFDSVDEIAYVEPREIASIEGLDEQTADELQTRARDYLERAAAELDARRIELGVADELKEIEGLTPAMMVALGEADIKTVEDFAGCASDDLIGWTERKAGETVKHKGAFTDLGISVEEANSLIMKARVHAGWIEAPAEEPAAEDAPEEAVG